MSNRFNKPEMLKANRERYFQSAMRHQQMKAAIELFDIERKSREEIRKFEEHFYESARG